MSNFNTISVEDWSVIMNGVPGVIFEPFDKVEVTSAGGVTSISFVNTAEESKEKTDRQILLETLAKSEQPFKYIVMGRDDEYNEIDNSSMRPFGTIHEAMAYGKQITMKGLRGHRHYNSVLIQPLLKDRNSFELTSEEVIMVCDIEKRFV